VGSYVSMMPWFAREAFHGDSGTLGLLISAAGLGALSGWCTSRCAPGSAGSSA
jgi:hypothetical protein